MDTNKGFLYLSSEHQIEQNKYPFVGLVTSFSYKTQRLIGDINAWGWVLYNRPLTEQERKDYGLWLLCELDNYEWLTEMVD